MAKEWSPNQVFDVFADERARSILIATHKQKRSVKDLNKLLDTSQSSIYRRVDLLVDFGLLKEQRKVGAEGHHYSVYEPAFENVDIRLEDEKVFVRVYGANDVVQCWEFTRSF